MGKRYNISKTQALQQLHFNHATTTDNKLVSYYVKAIRHFQSALPYESRFVFGKSLLHFISMVTLIAQVSLVTVTYLLPLLVDSGHVLWLKEQT